MSDYNDEGLARTVSWKDGMFIALGVPLLILPSIYDVSSIVWGLCILVWTFSVVQGFIQNLAYGEMVTVFPKATGLPGCAQAVFEGDASSKKFNFGKLIGAFSAWCYWFAWTPVVAIFTMMIGDYLIQMFSLTFDGMIAVGFYMLIGVIIVVLMYVLGSHGLEGGAKTGTILALLSLIPIVIILLGALLSGMFDFSRIAADWTAPGWSWKPSEIVLMLGCFGLAQWSACAWETAAIYGPEYKNPGKDVPKALFACGFICLIMYFFVSSVVFGSLGQAGVSAAGIATLVPIAEFVFGGFGSYIALFFLIVAMLLIIQTGFLGSSRTLHSMSHESNLPKWFGAVNKHGMPANAMIFVSVFNLLLVFIIEFSAHILEQTATSMTVLTASAIGYCIANGITLAAFVKTRRNPKFSSLERPFKAPKVWTYVITIMVGVQFFVWLPALLYWSYVQSNHQFIAIIMGIIILLAFVPLWYFVQRKEATSA